MSSVPAIEQRERELLPIVARTFAEQGYQHTNMMELARRCEVTLGELQTLWPSKSHIFIAALEYAYESAERTWSLLLHPDPPLEAASRLLAFAGHCGEQFSVSEMFMAGLEAADRPRIRKTLRRMNRRLARFLACEVANMHVAAMGGDDDETALRSQAGAVLRDLARVQQQADADAAEHRAALIERLTQAVHSVRPVGEV